jgi:hypothetical protein
MDVTMQESGLDGITVITQGRSRMAYVTVNEAVTKKIC